MSPGRAGVKIKMQGTSLQALKGMSKKKLGYYQRLVFDELMKHGDEGQTAKEIELTLNYNYTDSRVNELVAMGWIVRTDRKKINPTGASATVLIVPKYVRNGRDPIPLHDFKKFRNTRQSKDKVRYEKAKTVVVCIAREWAKASNTDIISYGRQIRRLLKAVQKLENCCLKQSNR